MVLRTAALAAAFAVASLPLALAAAPLRAGDHVAVTVFNHPELTSPALTIDGDGNLALPLVGNVVVAGLEPAAAAGHIGDALKPYLRQPVVSLSVLQQNATISVVGGPNSTLPYVPGQTLASVVAPLSSIAGLDLHHVSITRANVPFGSYDAVALLQRADGGPLLQPGDLIIVAQKPLAVNVLGVVKTPGMTHLDEGATILDAVNAAGGVADGAATGAVELFRNGTHQHVALSSDAATQAVHDGDIVTVPQAVHVAVGGFVAHPGDTPLTAGTTLIAAIYQAGGPLRYGDVSHAEVTHGGVQHVYDITKVPHGDTTQNPQLSEGDIVFVPQGNHVDWGSVFGAAGVIHWFF